MPFGDVFGGLDDHPFTGAVYTPSVEDPDMVEVLVAAGTQATIFEYFSSGSAVFSHYLDLMDAPEPGPPLASQTMVWAFVLSDESLIPEPAWRTWFLAYSDGNFYRYDMSFTWQSWDQFDNQYFSGAPGEPNPATIEAGWADGETGWVYLVGP